MLFCSSISKYNMQALTVLSWSKNKKLIFLHGVSGSFSLKMTRVLVTYHITGEIFKRWGQWGSSKWASQFFFRRCVRKNLNCRQFINYKHMFSVNKNSDILRSVHDQNHLAGYMRLPITAFIDFFRKIRDIFLYFVLIFCALLWD